MQSGFAKTLILSVSMPTVGRLWFALGWLWLNHFVSCIDTPTIGRHSILHRHYINTHLDNGFDYNIIILGKGFQ